MSLIQNFYSAVWDKENDLSDDILEVWGYL